MLEIWLETCNVLFNVRSVKWSDGSNGSIFCRCFFEQKRTHGEK